MKEYFLFLFCLYANIIAVKGDVLRYINLLQDIDLIIKHGKQYK